MSAIMNAARPKYAMKPIATIDGYPNGLTPDHLLVKSSMRGIRTNAVTAKRLLLLQELAFHAGFALTATDGYRDLKQQINLQLAHYDIGYFPNRADYNVYRGQVYSLKPKFAQAATPGLSIHGFGGRAIDFAEELDGDAQPEALSRTICAWLAVNGPLCGFFWTNPTEDWHGEDFDGDAPSVLQRPETLPSLPPALPVFDPVKGLWSLYPLNTNKPELRLKDPHMKGDTIRYLQGVMKRKALADLTIDGVFGPYTGDRVGAFQRATGLKDDEVVGPRTWAKVDEWANRP